jgi:hypothetical protein
LGNDDVVITGVKMRYFIIEMDYSDGYHPYFEGIIAVSDDKEELNTKCKELNLICKNKNDYLNYEVVEISNPKIYNESDLKNQGKVSAQETFNRAVKILVNNYI